jgi:hypothetical protein
MRKHVFSIVLSVLYSCSLAQNVDDLDAFEKAIKPGTELTYDIIIQGKSQQMVVTLTKTGAAFAFDWVIAEPENKSGTVSMSAAAVAGADALFSVFNGGADKLDKETSLLISRKIFNEVSTTAQAGIKVFGASDTVTTLYNTISEYNFSLNGNLVSVPGWELQSAADPKYTIQVLESYNYPIIYRLDIGISMILTSVKSK